MKPCACSNPKACTLGAEDCKYCAKRSVHCTECGRPIDEEKWCMCGCHNRGGVVGCGICGHWKARPDAVSGIEGEPPPFLMKPPIREEKVTDISVDMLFGIEAISNLGAKYGQEMQEPSKGFKKALEGLDWQETAEMFAQADTKWHAGEWRAFIEKIKADERTKIVGEIREKMPKEIKGNIGGRGIGFNECRTAILKVLEDYKNSK